MAFEKIPTQIRHLEIFFKLIPLKKRNASPTEKHMNNLNCKFYLLVYRNNITVKCLAQEHNIVVILARWSPTLNHASLILGNHIEFVSIFLGNSC